MARLRLVQHEFVVDEIRFDAATAQRLRRLDVVLEELGQKFDGELEPFAALLIVLRALLREFGKDPDEAKVRPAKIVESYEQ